MWRITETIKHDLGMDNLTENEVVEVILSSCYRDEYEAIKREENPDPDAGK